MNFLYRFLRLPIKNPQKQGFLTKTPLFSTFFARFRKFPLSTTTFAPNWHPPKKHPFLPLKPRFRETTKIPAPIPDHPIFSCFFTLFREIPITGTHFCSKLLPSFTPILPLGNPRFRETTKIPAPISDHQIFSCFFTLFREIPILKTLFSPSKNGVPRPSFQKSLLWFYGLKTTFFTKKPCFFLRKSEKMTFLGIFCPKNPQIPILKTTFHPSKNPSFWWFFPLSPVGNPPKPPLLSLFPRKPPFLTKNDPFWPKNPLFWPFLTPSDPLGPPDSPNSYSKPSLFDPKNPQFYPQNGANPPASTLKWGVLTKNLQIPILNRLFVDFDEITFLEYEFEGFSKKPKKTQFSGIFTKTPLFWPKMTLFGQKPSKTLKNPLFTPFSIQKGHF